MANLLTPAAPRQSTLLLRRTRVGLMINSCSRVLVHPGVSGDKHDGDISFAAIIGNSYLNSRCTEEE